MNNANIFKHRPNLGERIYDLVNGVRAGVGQPELSAYTALFLNFFAPTLPAKKHPMGNFVSSHWHRGSAPPKPSLNFRPLLSALLSLKPFGRPVFTSQTSCFASQVGSCRFLRVSSPAKVNVGAGYSGLRGHKRVSEGVFFSPPVI